MNRSSLVHVMICRMGQRTGQLLGAALLIGALAPTAAFAHSPIMGIGGVLGGALHALLIPEHGMGLVALGLFLGQRDAMLRRKGAATFAAVAIGGLVLAAFVDESEWAGDVLVLTAGMLGLLVALASGPAIVVWLFAAITGLTFALDSVPETTSIDEAIRMLIGSGAGALVVLAAISEVAALARGNVPRTIMRVLGSWIAAIAILVLSLRIVTRMTVG
jgi:urease accessory protein